MRSLSGHILYLFLLFSFQFTFAQNVIVEKIGTEQGLSNNNVVSIAQDRDGYMWFCTKDGLNRFDSSNFKVFKTTENNTNSISSNVLNCVYADKFADMVWIGSEKNGVDSYNYRTHEFTHYEHDYNQPDKNDISANGVTQITGDESGNIWFATYDGGIDFLNRETNEFTNFNVENTPGLGSNYNWCLFYDNEEKVYAGHVNEGFSIINPKTHTAVNFQHRENDPNSLADNTVTHILKDSKDRVWISTRNGLTLFNPISEQMVTFRNDPENPNSLSSNFIQKTFETEDHKLYIGTEGGGLNILDLDSLRFDSNLNNIKFEHILESETPNGLSSLSVQAVTQDSFGNIWLGGYGGGINFISSNEKFFKQIYYLPYIGNTNSLNAKAVVSICSDTDNNVWIANGFGGIGIYKDGEKIKQIDHINSNATQNFISIYKASDNRIWIGTAEGKVYFYDKNTDHFSTPDALKNLKSIPIYNFFEDSRGIIYMATDQGLNKYDPKTDSLKVYTQKNSELPDDLVRAIGEDSHGNIWIGSLIGGLSVFNNDFKRIKHYGDTYDFYSVNYIYRDSKNRMWIGSQNDLFLVKDQKVDPVMRIGKSSGLKETDIKSIIEGETDNIIWFSTTNEISKIDLNTMHVDNYNISDNIASGDYISGSVTKTSDGKIFFGSQNGATWFDQDIEQPDITSPLGSFTTFSVANTKNYLNQFTDRPFGKNIELNYNQNSFQIRFNVLDYSLANKVDYVYQMEGLDSNWFIVNSENEVTFRNLKPGDYQFNLKTRLPNHEWSENYNSLAIQINPPLWLTWWMKLIYFALFATIITYIIKFYKRKLKVENDLFLEKQSRQQEQDINEEKLKFFTNITHELRSPMTLILGPLEDLLSDDSLNKDQSKKLNMVHRVANRLLQSINQILEFRKSESKSRKLSVIKDDLVKYAYEIGGKYKDLGNNKGVDFEIDVPEEKIEMYFDPDVMTIILDNLLSNAFKYTPAGLVSLKVERLQETNVDYTVVTVSDTGYGITKEDLPHVFDRYYQAQHASHPIKGTGIGLALVKNMVELHEAEIEVFSTIEEGTTFVVKFLTNNSYPEAIHYYPEEAQIEEIEENSKNVILIVDDDPEIIDYIKDSLSDTYSIISAENGKVGLETAAEEIPDIIISDIMMPIMDGIEMCTLLKQDVRTSHIPLVLLTAKGSLHDQKIGYDVGVDSYLTKPFSSNLLKSRLKNILDAREKYSLSNSSKFKQKQEILNESIGELDKEFLRNLTKVIEDNLEDEEMNISYVAAQMNMSHSTLYRKIKALTNLTANEFIRKVRINYAEQLLITGQYNISEIMYQVGINSSSYFRQCFKDEFGMNPSEYLQKLKSN